MRLWMTLFLMMSFVHCSDLQAEQHPWRLKKEERGIKVYTRRVQGSSILEFKGQTIVDASIQEVINAFEDDAKVPSWFYNGVEPQVIKTINLNDKIYYLDIPLSWPMSDRDVVYQRVKFEGLKRGAVKYRMTSLPEWLPRKKGKVRIIHLRATWLFIPLGNGKTQIYFQQYAHPQGFVPAFIANEAVVDIPFYTIKNFRHFLRKTAVVNS
jgi:hypothetical protein